jgi:hypothetical protein
MNRLYLGGEPRLLMPLEQILLFKSFLDDIFGQKRWSPRAKRWWTKELEGERDILAEARRTTPPSSDQFKQARNRWLCAIRKAKRECWERLLQASDPGQVWKAINAKPQSCAMPPTLTSTSGEQYRTLEEKMEAIANISFPSNPADIPTIAQDTQAPEESGGNTDLIIGVQGQMIGALRASFPSSCLSLPSHYLPAMALLLDAPHYPFAVLVFGQLQL